MSHRITRVALLVASTSLALTALLAAPPSARGIGEDTRVDVRGVLLGERTEDDEPRPTARRRIAWEARKRTSIETRLRPTSAHLDDPSIFETPLLYLAGDGAFEPPSAAEVTGLRRFLERIHRG